jgi:hypothetical protein
MVGPVSATQWSSAQFRRTHPTRTQLLITMNRNRLALAAALTGLFASSSLRADGAATTPATDKPAAEKHGCSGKEGCSGKDKPKASCAGKAGCGAKDKAADKEKASCSGKEGCAGKDKPADKDKAACAGKEGCAGKDKPKA